jgi:hypothetical protein
VRATLTVLATALAIALSAGCGDDQEQRQALPAQDAGRRYSISEAESALEGAGLALQRDTGAYLLEDLQPPALEAVHYASQAGREFDLYAFATTQAARSARDDVASAEIIEQGGSYITAANLIAVLPEPPDDGFYRRVWSTMHDLARNAREPEPARGLAVATISREPDAFLGQQVTLSAPVLRVLPSGGDRPVALVLDGAGDESILVVSDSGEGFPPQLGGEGTSGSRPRVEVTGRVGRIGDEGGPALPPDAEVLAFRRGDAFVRATQVRVTDPRPAG